MYMRAYVREKNNDYDVANVKMRKLQAGFFRDRRQAKVKVEVNGQDLRHSATSMFNPSLTAGTT
jgi:hypothetical protein